jgi:putative membrane protein
MFYLIFSGVVCILVALFAIQNAMTVEVQFLFWTFTTSLVLVIFSCFLAGVLVTSLWVLKIKASHYLKDRKRKATIKDLEDEKAAIEEKLEMQMHAERQKTAGTAPSTTEEIDKIKKF